MTYLKLLFKTFYDITFVKNYAKNGKGTGVALMCLLSLIMTVIFMFNFIPKMPPVFNNDNIREAINQAFDQIPPIVIENGELVWEDGVVETFHFDKDHSMTIDTKNPIPSANQISLSTFYLTKTDLYVNNQRKIQSVAWKDIQYSFEKDPLDLTSPEVREAIVLLAKYLIITFMVFTFLFAFLFLWLMNGIFASIARTIISKLNAEFKDMDHYIIRRTAAAAVTPVLILITLSQVITGFPGFWIKALITIILGAWLMTKFNPEKETTEQNIIENKE